MKTLNLPKNTKRNEEPCSPPSQAPHHSSPPCFPLIVILAFHRCGIIINPPPLPPFGQYYSFPIKPPKKTPMLFNLLHEARLGSFIDKYCKMRKR